MLPEDISFLGQRQRTVLLNTASNMSIGVFPSVPLTPRPVEVTRWAQMVALHAVRLHHSEEHRNWGTYHLYCKQSWCVSGRLPAAETTLGNGLGKRSGTYSLDSQQACVGMLGAHGGLPLPQNGSTQN